VVEVGDEVEDDEQQIQGPLTLVQILQELIILEIYNC
jgi:hypothetical protein